MDSISIQRFYDDIVTRGRRNVPTFNEARRDAAVATKQMHEAEAYRL